MCSSNTTSLFKKEEENWKIKIGELKSKRKLVGAWARVEKSMGGFD